LAGLATTAVLGLLLGSSLAGAVAFGFSLAADAVAGLFLPTSSFLGAAPSKALYFFLYSRISRSYLSFSLFDKSSYLTFYSAVKFFHSAVIV
jgi:hypothetical protein